MKKTNEGQTIGEVTKKTNVLESWKKITLISLRQDGYDIYPVSGFITESFFRYVGLGYRSNNPTNFVNCSVALYKMIDREYSEFHLEDFLSDLDIKNDYDFQLYFEDL